MNCPKCSSENVNVQIVTDKIKTSHTSFIRTLCRWFLILCTCGLWLLVPKRKENSKVKNSSMAVCQNCGHRWKV